MSEHEPSLGWMQQVATADRRPRWRMCKMAERGELAELCRLVLQARYLCRKCGRVSREATHLCKPVLLGPDAVAVRPSPGGLQADRLR